MATEEAEGVSEIPGEEKTEDGEIEDTNDNNDNGPDEPLKEPASKPEGKNKDENKEKVPFLCWRMTRQKRRKVIVTLILYVGFFALVRSLIFLPACF